MPAAKKETKKTAAKKNQYTASDIEVLEGLEPVRRRPGMYIGGTDSHAMHHLFAEVIDNAMDEAVAGHASYIEVQVLPNNELIIRDNGRGIPIDPHPKYKDKSALEVIMTMLHAGGKFGSGAYDTAGGLHGVGVSVVNALASSLLVEVIRDETLYTQSFSRGIAKGKLKKMGKAKNKRGTSIRFTPDTDIFSKGTDFSPSRLYAMSKAKAYLFGGVEIRWQCDKSLLKKDDPTPLTDTLKFPNGLADYLTEQIGKRPCVTDRPFTGKVQKAGGHGSVEWAVNWAAAGMGDADGMSVSYCNTIPTPEGGTHEQGLRSALTKGIRNYAERTKKKAAVITAEDVMGTAAAFISVFIREPEFQGQTKDRLSTPDAARIVESTVRDYFEHYLAESPQDSDRLLDWVVSRAEDRIKRRQERDVSRKSAARKLRLPGKLADCSQSAAQGSELFIVEGDSAGGSAKQARNRKSQAVLPLRGKILNVANSTVTKLQQSQQIADLAQALGCGTGAQYDESRLRYDKVIIMTDADVDGAHIAALLVTFFHEQMPDLIYNGHLYLAVPPLYRLAQGGKTFYARDDAHRLALLNSEFKKSAKVEISRFKGLGEMMPAQLKETTMHPDKRQMLQVILPEDMKKETKKILTNLMGNKPDLRYKFIQENAGLAVPELLDI
ncbi:MAG: DNA topoisomerase IV subunit B [Alphaproteobacteria bacterium]|nr:DNA topoisomerase IV subunit B [Alphaproteobacteria bacterium]